MPQAPSPATPTVLCRGVTKRYELGARSVDALRGIDLAIEGAGFYAIMGASGSGKSTLMHLVAGLDRPTAGEVSVAGVRVDRMSEAELTMYRRRQVGIVFQHFNLLPSMTALENVMLPALLDGMSRAASETRARQLMDELGVEERAEHRPDALSGGEQQRVAIARALFFAPPVILADEPTGNLDSAAAARLFALLTQIARTHNTLLLMVTHEPAAAANCQRVIVLRDGVVAGAFDTTTPQEGKLDAGALALRAQELARPTW
ncbi:MAG: ABC transporter ATP-binding protein [Planctomycetota bacterium]|jgi:putative ABC transport system ATP-binding protein|nr:MAG: ABC transporter ATP-binding protein [Planctomycetota bacterium]